MCLISLKVAGPDFGNREGAKNTITDVSAFSPQLVTCRGQAIWYVEGVDTICSRYRVSKRPDQVSGFFVVPEVQPVLFSSLPLSIGVQGFRRQRDHRPAT